MPRFLMKRPQTNSLHWNLGYQAWAALTLASSIPAAVGTSMEISLLRICLFFSLPFP